MILLLPCVLAGLSAFATADWHFYRLLGSYFLSVTLIVPFRLADDLADRKQDQARYPDRELCRTEDRQGYVNVLVMLFSIAIIAILSTRGSRALLFLLSAMLLIAFWYKVREFSPTLVICNYHLVLTKYAAFELILIDPMSWRIPLETWWSSLTAYLWLLLWEVVHDAKVRDSVAARRLAVIEFSSWLAWTAWLVLRP